MVTEGTGGRDRQRMAAPRVRTTVDGTMRTSPRADLGFLKRSYLWVTVLSLAGIALGSFIDFPLSVALARRTSLGRLFQDYAFTVVDLLYAFAGVCLWRGFRKMGPRHALLSRVLLGLGVYLSLICYLEGEGCCFLVDVLGYVGGTSPPLMVLVSLLPLAAALAAILAIGTRLIDDGDPERLIAVGALIIISGFFAQYTCDLLKALASRPRPLYVLSLDGPASGFRAWWEFRPFFAGEKAAVGSWPSNHMMLVTLMLNLPLAASVLTVFTPALRRICLGTAYALIVASAYNAIHMERHFLSDVCFGALFTTCLLALLSRALIERR